MAKRKPKPRPIYVSKKLELDYTRALLKIVKAMHKDTVAALIPLLEQPSIGDGVMVADAPLQQFERVLARMRRDYAQSIAPIADNLATDVVKKQAKKSDEQLAQLIFTLNGIDFTSVMTDEGILDAVNTAITANSTLIKSIPQEYLNKVEQAVLAGLQGGTLATDLEEDLLKIEGLTENRAKLIARDQLGKINSRISQIRQESLGIEGYTWSSSRDKRVRPEHRARNGKTYKWSEPPPDGHPGQAIRCRCVAIPDMSNFEI